MDVSRYKKLYERRYKRDMIKSKYPIQSYLSLQSEKFYKIQTDGSRRYGLEGEVLFVSC